MSSELYTHHYCPYFAFVDSKERPTVTELSFTYIVIIVVVLVVVLCALFASVIVNICFCVKHKQSKMASDVRQSST